VLHAHECLSLTPMNGRLLRLAAQISKRYSSVAATSDEGLKLMLKDQLKLSMRAKEKSKVAVIKGVLADVLNAEKSGLSTMPSISQIIQKSIKRRNDSIAQYEEGGRADLANQERQEKAILEQFLPKQLSKAAIEEIVSRVVKEKGIGSGGVKDLGRLMKILNTMPELDVSLAPKQLLSEVSKSVLLQTKIN
jgi:uncharacterized protein